MDCPDQTARSRIRNPSRYSKQPFQRSGICKRNRVKTLFHGPRRRRSAVAVRYLPTTDPDRLESARTVQPVLMSIARRTHGKQLLSRILHLKWIFMPRSFRLGLWISISSALLWLFIYSAILNSNTPKWKMFSFNHFARLSLKQVF